MAIKREIKKSKSQFPNARYTSAWQVFADLKYIYQGLPLNQLATRREGRSLNSPCQPSTAEEFLSLSHLLGLISLGKQLLLGKLISL